MRSVVGEIEKERFLWCGTRYIEEIESVVGDSVRCVISIFVIDAGWFVLRQSDEMAGIKKTFGTDEGPVKLLKAMCRRVISA